MTKTELLPDDARRAGVQTLVDVLEYRAGRQPLDVVFRSLQGAGELSSLRGSISCNSVSVAVVSSSTGFC